MIAPYYQREGVLIYHADFRDVMSEMPEGSIEAVITDPPYEKKYGDLWAPLGEMSARVLVRGGSLLSIVPHYALPDILAQIGRHLKYRWTMCMEQRSGAHPRMAMGIEVLWKPVVWWVQGAWPAGRGFRKDMFESVASHDRKKSHKWEQTLSWADACLKFVPEGQVVLDPMMGSGTLLIAALQSGRPSIGIESDEATCELAVKRLENSEEEREWQISQ